MINLEAGDDQPGSLAAKGTLLSIANLCCDCEEVLRKILAEIGPLVNFDDWYNQGVAGCYRIDRHKDDAQFVAVYEFGGDVPVDDLGEKRCHVSTISGLGCTRIARR